MKQAYPVIITKDKDFFVASIPDFETGKPGESLAEAIEMARDAIGMCGCYMQDEKKDIPIPTDIGNITKEASDILTLVDVDFDEYRKKQEMRTVRKNVTIPSWLNEEAESANINFSALLQKAIKAALHLL